MEIQANKNQALVGAGVGTIAGVAAGSVVGGLKKQNYLKGHGITKGMTQKDYVDIRANANLEKCISENLSPKQIKKIMPKVIDTAKKNYANIMQKAKNTKNTWLVALGVAGLAAGTIAGIVAKNKSESKQTTQNI